MAIPWCGTAASISKTAEQGASARGVLSLRQAAAEAELHKHGWERLRG